MSEGALIVNLVDRISVLIDPSQDILIQQNDIINKINKHAGSIFKPDHVEAFNEVSQAQYFWLDLISEGVGKHAHPSMPEGYRFDDKSLLNDIREQTTQQTRSRYENIRKKLPKR